MVAVQHSFAYDDLPLPLDPASARADVERLAAGLPQSLLATRPEEVRRAARACIEAHAAAERRRARVGDAPAFDEDAAFAADEARAEVAAAKLELDVALDDAVRLVSTGNAWGAAGIGVGLVLLGAGVEPMSTPFAALILGAAAGPSATSLLALSRRGAARTRLVRAIDRWSGALQACGVSTRGELEARRIAAVAWRSREVEANAAERAAAHALAAWEAIAGKGVPPHHGAALATHLVALRSAQLQLFRSLLHEAARSPLPVVDVRQPGNDGWLGDALSRLRGRGMRLWSGR